MKTADPEQDLPQKQDYLTIPWGCSKCSMQFEMPVERYQAHVTYRCAQCGEWAVLDGHRAVSKLLALLSTTTARAAQEKNMKNEELETRVEPSVPCVETVGSTAEESPNAVTAEEPTARRIKRIRSEWTKPCTRADFDTWPHDFCPDCGESDGDHDVAWLATTAERLIDYIHYLLDQSYNLRQQFTEATARATELEAFYARCCELGATDTDLVKHALEDQARIRTEMLPLSLDIEDARRQLQVATARAEAWETKAAVFEQGRQAVVEALVKERARAEALEKELLLRCEETNDLIQRAEALAQENETLKAEGREAFRALVEQWHAKGLEINTFHATMGSGWIACSNELAALLVEENDALRKTKG